MNKLNKKAIAVAVLGIIGFILIIFFLSSVVSPKHNYSDPLFSIYNRDTNRSHSVSVLIEYPDGSVNRTWYKISPDEMVHSLVTRSTGQNPHGEELNITFMIDDQVPIDMKIREGSTNFEILPSPGNTTVFITNLVFID